MDEAAPPPSPPETIIMLSPSGEALSVPVGEVAQARAAGLSFDGSSPVFVRKGGTADVSAMSAGEAARYFDSTSGLFAKGATSRQYKASEDRREMDSLGNQALSLGAGAVRGATFGLSDAVIADAGGREWLQKSERYNPTLNLVGEIGGAIAPALLSGGSSAAVSAGRAGLATAREATAFARAVEAAAPLARMATAPSRGVASLAGLAERGVARVAGEGILGRTVSGAANGIVEGAFQGVGNAISRASIDDTELTAEKILAGAGHGAVFGGALGGGVSLAGALLRKGAERVSNGVAHLSGDGEKLAAKLEKGTTIESALNDLADTHAIKSLGGTESQMKVFRERVKADPGFGQRVVKQVLDDLPAVAERKSIARMGPEELAQAAEKNRVDKWEKIDSVVKAAEGIPGEAPSMFNVVSRAKEEIVTKLRAEHLTDKAADNFASYLDDIGEKWATKPMDLSAAREVRKKLDAEINFSKLDPLNQSKKELRTIIEDEISRVMESRSQEGGAKLAAEYAAAKADYGAAKTIADMSEKGATKTAKNLTGGLREQFGMLAGSNALGTAIGAVVPLPGASLIGNFVGGLAGMALQNQVRKYGSQTAAVLARQAVESDLLRTVSRGVDGRIEAQAARLTSGSGSRALTASERAATLKNDRPAATLQERYEERRDQVAMANVNGPRQVQIPMNDPRVAKALQERAAAGDAFLRGLLPPAFHEASIAPHLDQIQPSKSDMSRFVRAADAIDNPVGLLERAADGRGVTAEEVDAVRAVYPRIYAEMRERVTEELATRTKPVPYAQRIQIGILFDAPTDPTLAPAFIRSVQATYRIAQPGPGGMRPPSPTGPHGPKVDLARGISSRTDRVSEELP